ncbi:MAG: DUF308 domain-containing protein [Egibacteraceae bacterium]
MKQEPQHELAQLMHNKTRRLTDDHRRRPAVAGCERTRGYGVWRAGALLVGLHTLALISGVLSVVFVILLVILPGPGTLALVWLIGLYAVIFGVFTLALAWRARKAQAQPSGVPHARHA